MNTKSQKILFIGFAITLVALLAFSAAGWPAQARLLAAPFVPGALTKTAGPVLAAGASGAWDDLYAFAPSVLLDGTTYKMWYAGSGTANATRRIGYATSPNGTTWTRQGSAPVLEPGSAGSWDAKQVGFPAVIKEDSTYKMWYTALDAADIGRVGYATSTDGIAWTKYASNPVLSGGAGNSWDSAYVGAASVIKVGSTYHMWYRGGLSGGIGYATSPDGITWTKSASNPVIPIGSGAWDNTTYAPRALFDGLTFHLWYSASDLSGNLSQVGYATSSDGVHWTRKGLVLPQGSSGAWDSGSADHAAVLQVGSTLMMWYSGFNGTSYQIGYASAPATLLDRKIFIPAVKK